jgi:hypothetical protein
MPSGLSSETCRTSVSLCAVFSQHALTTRDNIWAAIVADLFSMFVYDRRPF